MGLCFDASSGFEVSRAIAAGISPSCISLSAQELPENILELLSLGIHFNACSMHQLVSYGELRKHFPEKVRDSCGVRFNPGVGSGGTGKTNVGGPAASFGIWHAYKDEVAQVALTYGLRIVRIHTHIGSGSDPLVWERATHLSLRLVHHFPHVTTLNLGGGFKVARMPYEKSTDLQVVGAYVNQCLSQFAMETKRQLHLEIEPGTYLVANAGVLLCRVQDIVDTLSGSEGAGYRFLKVNSGMTEVLRPSLYGAQHPIALVAAEQKTAPREEHSSYVVVGHCCESGDLFSCEPGEPEALRTVSFPRPVRIGDYLSIEGAGAYCSSMSTKNYNSFPEAPETLLRMDGSIALLRQRQTLKQILQNEIAIIL